MDMRTERQAHIALQPIQQDAYERIDWSMRQFVDEMKALLTIHPEHAKVAALMTERGVPVHVQRRVLAGV